MSGVHCFTSLTFSYLARASVLASTLKEHHPDWTLWAVISDRLGPEGDPEGELDVFDRVVWLDDLKGAGGNDWVFGHNVVELCTAVKGLCLEQILAAGAEKVIYLDPDIALFADLSSVLDRLDVDSIVLTPHLLDPELEPFAIRDNEVTALLHGTYNLGFLGVSDTDEGRRFADWWRKRLQFLCYEDVANGIFTDQRWCDLVPSLFEGVGILRDRGLNVASWNLSQRKLSFDGAGSLYAGAEVLRFFHFTKIDKAGELMVERYAGDSLAPFDLIRWYLAELKRYASSLGLRKWAYGTYDDGEEILPSDRIIYRTRGDLRSAFPNPYLVGEGSYRTWAYHHGFRDRP